MKAFKCIVQPARLSHFDGRVGTPDSIVGWRPKAEYNTDHAYDVAARIKGDSCLYDALP